MKVFESYFIDLVGRKASCFLDNIIPKRPLYGGASQKKFLANFYAQASRLDFHYDLQQNGKMFFENIPNKFQINSNY